MRKVPELRFDGFEGEWEISRLGKISSKITKGTTPKEYGNGTVNFIKLENINDTGNICPMTTISSEIHEGALSRSILRDNDILLSIAGALGRVGIVKNNILPANTNQALSIIRLFENYKAIFVFYYLRNGMLEKEINRIATVGAQPNISLSQVGDFKINLPKPLEQEQIGDLFRKIDDLIEIQEGKVSEMRDCKKSMLQKMFPKKDELVPEFRFDGFDGEWKNVYVKDIGSFLGGTSIESYFNKKGDYKVISIGSYSNNSKYIDQGLRVDLNDKTKSKLLSRNDLAMVLNDKTTQGNIIGRALLIDEDNKYIFNQRTQRITPNFDKYNSLFLYYLFNSDIFRNKIKKISQGNTQIYVNWPNVESILLKVPKKEEQAKIGQFFKTLDTQIENEEKLLDSYKMMKKSLLQKMFV